MSEQPTFEFKGSLTIVTAYEHPSFFGYVGRVNDEISNSQIQILTTTQGALLATAYATNQKIDGRAYALKSGDIPRFLWDQGVQNVNRAFGISMQDAYNIATRDAHYPH